MQSNRQSRARVFTVSLLFGVAILLLLSISVLAWVSRARLDEAQNAEIQFQKLDRMIADLGTNFLVAETNQRGFLLSGDASFLSPYEDAIAEEKAIKSKLEKFDSSFADLISRLLVVRARIEERTDQMRRTILARKNGGLQEAVKAMDLEEDVSRSIYIQQEIENLKTEVELRLREAEHSYRIQVRRRTLIMNFAAGTALVAGMVGLALLIGHIRARGREEALEREKAAAERSDHEKSKFLASMNHEIRTPLNAMLGFSELLEKEVSSQKGVRFLKAIEQSGHSLSELINDILDLSKIEAGHLELEEEPFRLREFGDEIQLLFENQALEKGLEWRVSVAANCPEVILIDGMRLRQILVNLIGNALKFTSEGSVQLRFNSEEVGTSGLHTLTCVVEDTGRGVAPEKKASIFKPFQQARLSDEMKGGTGLGLTISRELASLMGGEIQLESAVGEGARFSLVIPEVEELAEALTPETNVDADWDFDRIRKSKILVVDDNDYNRELIAGFFDESHHELGFATNGQDALDELEQSSYDLVLMDVRMPVMDGEEARQRILEDPNLRSIPVIAVTASSLLREEKRLRKVFSGYIRKPFSGAKLYDAVRQVLGSTEVPSSSNSGNSATKEFATVEPIPEDMALHSELVAIYDEHWDRLTKAMVFSDIVEVAELIRGFGEQYDNEAVREYASRLKQHVEEFNQVALERELSGFTEFFASR